LTVLLTVQSGDGLVGRAVGRDIRAADERGLCLDALGWELDVGHDVADAGDGGDEQEAQQEERAAPAPEDALALAVGLDVGRVRRFLLPLRSTRRRPCVGTAGLRRHGGGVPYRRADRTKSAATIPVATVAAAVTRRAGGGSAGGPG